MTKLNISTNHLAINSKNIAGQESSLTETFRKLYYTLYGNSNSSRAEKIFEDIGKLLLIKYLSEKNKYKHVIENFHKNKNSANKSLLPILTSNFPDLITKDDKFSLDDQSLKFAFEVLSGINLNASSASVMGDAFQTLIGPGLRGDKGQFFTPKELVKTMVLIANPQEGHKIVDPACGTGGFLVESFGYLQQNKKPSKKKTQILGFDKDVDMFRLGGAMVNVATKSHGKIFQNNSLDLKKLKTLVPSPFNADIILTNPPFGSKIAVTDKKILKQFDLGHEWNFLQSEQKWIKSSKLKKSQDPQILFIEVCLNLLKDNGIVGIVLPEGIFGNKKSGYIWDYIREQGSINIMIDCPRTTFQPSTDTKTNVIFIRKHNPKKATLH